MGVIPARIGSTRLPRKPLLEIAGRPLIEWVWRRMAALEVASELVVATDDREVIEVVEAFGGRAIATRSDHTSGTDRVAEVAERSEFTAYPWIINLQGDEPFVPRAAVEAALEQVRAGRDVGTVATPLEDLEGWHDPAAVKVVRADDGRALYFSRAPIPYDRAGEAASGAEPRPLRHIGLYAFARDALRRASGLPPNPLERREGLEQLRWLAAGLEIGVAVIEDGGGPGIDTEADLQLAERILGERDRHE